MPKAFGLIYTGESDMRLRDLTRSRAVAAVPVGGRYRIIDILLSNLVHSGARGVGVITQRNYHSLMDHLGSGKEWDLGRKRDGLYILAPFISRENKGSYSGLLEAVRSNIGFIRRTPQEYAIITGSNTVYNMNYSDALEKHVADGADITVLYSVSPEPGGEDDEFVHLGIDTSGRVYDVEINPVVPRFNNVSMDAYIISKQLLIRLIDLCVSRGQYDWNRDVLQRMRDELKIVGYRYDGYIRHITSVNAFYRLHMDLLDEGIRTQLLSGASPVFTKIKDEPPVRYMAGAAVSNALIADGCALSGAVKDSVLFRSVTVGKGASVRGSILMQDVKVEEGVVLENVIIDKNAVIRAGKRLIGQPNFPVVISKNAVV